MNTTGQRLLKKNAVYRWMHIKRDKYCTKTKTNKSRSALNYRVEDNKSLNDGCLNCASSSQDGKNIST